ncbi:unnamed protein product [Prunus armeniaca]|uniref:Uncharacterized protein n=1 Tax=Prunus armeniaca TaxID=36596 RepID=A0A6J5WK01_PRUAR|nr:hypothetical protein GBA52_007291 [Prunus armeniaca]CAB4270259.1 unnamed protein product [Prunus armeniaca]CAB4300663.1 unnamed protein product [Prunus armeniaca]
MRFNHQRSATERSLEAMGSEAEVEEETLKLPLFSVPQIQSLEPSGSLTPPLYTSVSVPFRWEEEPGKPRPCTALITLPNPTDFSQKCLELPPRLLLETKQPSPTTVLEGPYLGRSKFQSSSFRMGMECYGAFSPERGQLGAVVLSKRGLKEKGWFDSWGRRILKGKREVGGASYVFPSSVDGESDGSSVGESSSSRKVKTTRIRRAGSLSSLSHARPDFWTTIYQGLKQAVPWKSRKLKKDGIVM